MLSQNVTQTIRAYGATQTVSFVYDYIDELKGAQRRVETARSGYTVTATSGGELYKNTYQFDAAGREVYAEQDADGDTTANDKRVVREYFLSGGPEVHATGDETPYAARKELLTRSQKVGGDFQTVLKTATFYENEDAHLVRRIEHLNSAEGVLHTAAGQPLIHLSNFDALDRLRRYVDRAGILRTIGDEPYQQSDHEIAYGRVETLRDGLTTDIGYDLEGHVTGLRDVDGSDKHYTFVWGADDRLVKTTVDKTGTTEDGEIYFYYDPFGRLIAKHVKVGTTTEFTEFSLYDGNAVTLQFTGNESGTTLVAREFNDSRGNLLALDDFSTGGSPRLFWTLNDAYGTVRDVVRFDGGQALISNLDYDAHGKATATFAAPNLPIYVVRYQGRTYHGEDVGYYDGSVWTSPLVEGRSLSPVSSLGLDRYGKRDPAKPAEGPSFSSNPYKWAVQGMTDRLIGYTGIDFWGSLSEGEYFAVQVGAVGISIIAGVTAPLFGTSLTGLAAGGAASGAIEAGGTYALLQGIDAYSGRNLARGSVTEFLVESALGGASGAILGAGLGLGGRTFATALRPIRDLNFSRVGQNALRFVYDNRAFPTISRQYWKAPYGPANGRSLHHWLFPQSATWVPRGIRNAGFNLLELPPIIRTPFGGLNQWMGMSRSPWAPVVDWSIRIGIPTSIGGTAYGGSKFGEYIFVPRSE